MSLSLFIVYSTWEANAQNFLGRFLTSQKFLRRRWIFCASCAQPCALRTFLRRLRKKNPEKGAHAQKKKLVKNQPQLRIHYMLTINYNV